MHFEHPEILFALFLLAIPLLVHLFQLRKFKKERFTNLKFLRKATLKTRKSSRIKEWLVLFTRIMALGALIFAFAKPFIPASDESLLSSETVIYLDNSYSMQAKGSNGSLLRRSIQDLLEYIPDEESISLFTNNSIHEDLSLEKNREELQEITFSPKKMEWHTVALTAEKLFKEEAKRNELIIISDFQKSYGIPDYEETGETNISLVKLQPKNHTNISVDTVIVPSAGLEEMKLELQLSATGNPVKDIPVSVYDGPTLLAKKTVKINEELVGKASFRLPASTIKNGRVEIDDTGLPFDNQLFFSINEPEAIKVAVISGERHDFLRRIFRAPEFELHVFPENQVNYNNLSEANLVILNELAEIPRSLARNLEKQLQEKLFLILIPSKEAETSYNNFLARVELPLLNERIERELRITDISYDHPLYKGVFEDQVLNFQYPKVSSYFRMSKGGIPALSFENGAPFLVQKENSFLFLAPLNKENTNFQNAPLIVPSFFNIGRMSLPSTQLYYINGKRNELGMNIKLQKDEVIKLVTQQSSFIPLQRHYENKTLLLLEENPIESGQYQVQRDSLNLKTISFNINRNESQLEYHNLNSVQGVEIFENIADVFEAVEAKKEIKPLWKWFVIFALFFLLMEILILKFFK